MFFMLNVILAGHYVNVNVVFCGLKIDLSFVLHAKGVYWCAEVTYHTVVYSTLLRYKVFSFML